MPSRHALPSLLAGALIATVLLGLARIELARITPRAVIVRNQRIAARIGTHPPTNHVIRQCDDVAFFINRMAARVPWRSDCLVQALAGQRWLAWGGIASEIAVGAAKRADGSLNAHAWLRLEGRVVLGGDVADLQPLLDPDQFPRDLR